MKDQRRQEALDAIKLFHEENAKTAALEAKAKEKALAEAQLAKDMGLADKAQTIASEVATGKRTPSQQMLDIGNETRGRIKHPKARANYDKAMASVVAALRKQEQFTTAAKEVQRAQEDGVLQDEAGAQSYMERLKAKYRTGESPDDILTELSKARMDRAAKATFAQENAEKVQKAQALVDTLPEGKDKRMLLMALSEYEQSPSKQSQKNAGNMILGAAQRALAKPEPGELQQQFYPGVTREAFQNEETMSGGGPAFDQAAYDRYAAGIAAEKERRYPGAGNGKSLSGAPMESIMQAAQAFLDEGMKPSEISESLKRNGVKLTPKVARGIQLMLNERNNYARSTGGADRR